MAVRTQAIFSAMHITCCVLSAALFFPLFLLTNGMTRTGANTGGEEDVGTADKYYSETAILEIQFRNKCKKSCTSTVISDTVVITAARCLVYGDSKRTRSAINLDMSFIVIGTKKMHASGREQYLPIERIQFHPELRTQHVDLALVYTDSSMKAGRGGAATKFIRSKVVQNERVMTVVSWEPMSESERREKGLLTSGNIFVPDDDDGKPIGRKSSSSESRQNQFRAGSNDEQESLNYTTNEEGQKAKPQDVSKSVATGDEDPSSEISNKRWQGFRRSLYDLGIVNKQSPNVLASAKFMLLTPQMCRTFLQRARPKVYKEEELSNMACFTSDSRYITDDDLGAGVFYNGKLFAVTVDHAEMNLQYVGLAMQVSCFCDWLIRKVGAEIHCVPDCCMKENDDLDVQQNYTSHVKGPITTRASNTDFATEHHTKTSSYSYQSYPDSTKTSQTHHDENEHRHNDATTTEQRHNTINSFNGFPDFTKSSHKTTESTEDRPHFTNEHHQQQSKAEHYKATDKGHYESHDEYEKNHSDANRPPNHEITHKSANDQFDARTTNQLSSTPREISGHKIVNMDSYEKKPQFKSQDKTIYSDHEAAPGMMKLISYPTEPSERMMDSRLAGLEYYLVE